MGLQGVECITLQEERMIEEAPAAYKAIDPVVYKTLPFSEVKEGLRIMESRELYGKVVITR